MFGRKSDKKNAQEALLSVAIDNIMIEENLSKAKIKEYSNLFAQIQEQLLVQERELAGRKEELTGRKSNLPMTEQTTRQYEEKRNVEKAACKEHLEEECNKLLSGIKRYQGKKKKHKLLGTLALGVIVTGAIAYYIGVYHPMVENLAEQKNTYEAEHENLVTEHEEELQKMLTEQQALWDAEILGLEEQKQILEDEIKTRLQTAY